MARISYDIPDLRALGELARTGGFNRAADVLAITPSALSRRIAKLEAAVGGDLAMRSTRAMALTPLGERLLARAAPLLAALDDSVQEASRIASGLEGQVVLGCVSSIAYSLLPEAVARFRIRHPDVRVSLRDAEGPQVIAALMNQEVEFAVTTLLDKPVDLTVDLIASDPFVAVCSPEHAIAKQGRITLASLATQRLVGFRASSATRRQLDDALASRNLELPWFDEVDQLSTLVGYLRSGHFVGVVPRLLARYLQNVTSVPVTGLKTERRIYLARRRHSSLSVPAQALWHAVSTISAEAKKHS